MNHLENEVLKLRALEPEDLQYLYAWENDTRLWEYGSTLVPYSKYVLHQYLESAALDIYEAKQLRLILVLKETDAVIGTVDLYDFDPFHNRAGIGILIDESHQRRGYAVQTLSLVRDYTFGFLGLSQLYAYIPADNTPSLRLFNRAGYREAGCLKKWNKTANGRRDVFIYQLFPDTSTE